MHGLAQTVFCRVAIVQQLQSCSYCLDLVFLAMNNMEMLSCAIAVGGLLCNFCQICGHVADFACKLPGYVQVAMRVVADIIDGFKSLAQDAMRFWGMLVEASKQGFERSKQAWHTILLRLRTMVSRACRRRAPVEAPEPLPEAGTQYDWLDTIDPYGHLYPQIAGPVPGNPLLIEAGSQTVMYYSKSRGWLHDRSLV